MYGLFFFWFFSTTFTVASFSRLCSFETMGGDLTIIGDRFCCCVGIVLKWLLLRGLYTINETCINSIKCGHVTFKTFSRPVWFENISMSTFTTAESDEISSTQTNIEEYSKKRKAEGQSDVRSKRRNLIILKQWFHSNIVWFALLCNWCVESSLSIERGKVGLVQANQPYCNSSDKLVHSCSLSNETPFVIGTTAR